MREKVEPVHIVEIACEVTENRQRPVNFSLLQLSKTSLWNIFFWFEKKKVKSFFLMDAFIKKVWFSSKKFDKKRLNQFFDQGEYRL